MLKLPHLSSKYNLKKWILILQIPICFAIPNLNVTGGGVVVTGGDMVLQYNVNKRWDTCYWYRYEHQTQVEWCRFKYDQANNSIHANTCDPQNFAGRIQYTGTVNNVCEVTVRNLTEDDDCVWATRVDADLENLSVDVVVATPISELIIRHNSVIANKEGNIRC